MQTFSKNLKVSTERERGGGSVVSTESERGSVVVCLRESLNHREKRKTSNVGGREEHQI